MSIGLSGGRGGVRDEGRRGHGGSSLRSSSEGRRAAREAGCYGLFSAGGGGNADKVCFALSNSLRVIYSRAGRRLRLQGSLWKQPAVVRIRPASICATCLSVQCCERVGCAREQTRVWSVLMHVPTEDREGLLSLMTTRIHLIGNRKCA